MQFRWILRLFVSIGMTWPVANLPGERNGGLKKRDDRSLPMLTSNDAALGNPNLQRVLEQW